MRTHLFSTAITTKAAATAAAVVLIGGGAALADTYDAPEPEPEPEEPVELEVEDDDDGDAYALGRDDRGGEEEQDSQTARIERFCKDNPDTDSPRCPNDSSDEEEVEEEALGDEGEVADDGEGKGENQRSATADRVHAALIGGDDLDDDETFGQRVSSRAHLGQPGDLGKLVSGSARGGEHVPDDLDLSDDREHQGQGRSGDDEEEIEQAKAHGRG